MFIAPAAEVRATSSGDLAQPRKQAKTWRSADMGSQDQFLTDAALRDVSTTAHQLDYATFQRAVSAVQSARIGDYEPIPNNNSAEAIFKQFLAAEKIDGWVYVQEDDGYLHPYLVSDIKFEHADSSRSEEHTSELQS